MEQLPAKEEKLVEFRDEDVFKTKEISVQDSVDWMVKILFVEENADAKQCCQRGPRESRWWELLQKTMREMTAKTEA